MNQIKCPSSPKNAWLKKLAHKIETHWPIFYYCSGLNEKDSLTVLAFGH